MSHPSPTPPREGLPVTRVGALAVCPPDQRWLVRHLWTANAVGILGGAPKSCKSWLGLEIATAVASGHPCLGRFPVEQPGPVLVYLAEDALPMVRARLESLCEARGLRLASLDVHVITAPVLRLDQAADQERLRVTLAQLRPKLLVLDPLVRLHRLNENDAKDVSGLLGYLRELQRTFELAVVLVHHARKRVAASPGEALRGSSDLYAWTDVTLHLGRRDDALLLQVEHRSAPSPDPILVRLASRQDGTGTHLEILGQPTPEADPPATLAAAILEILASSEAPLGTETIREQLGAQKQRTIRALKDLQEQGRITRPAPRAGWRLAQAPVTTSN